jgi:hypothetical protein
MIQTPLSDKMIAEGQGKELDKMLKTFVPMKRLGRPEEIADAVPWLCSDAANYRPVDLSRWRLCDALENGAACRATGNVVVMWWLYSSSRSRNIFACNSRSESDATIAGPRCGRVDGTRHQ